MEQVVFNTDIIYYIEKATRDLSDVYMKNDAVTSTRYGRCPLFCAGVYACYEYCLTPSSRRVSEGWSLEITSAVYFSSDDIKHSMVAWPCLAAMLTNGLNRNDNQFS